MTKHLRFLFVTLLTLVWTVTVGGQTITTIWSEDWSGVTKINQRPSDVNPMYSQGKDGTVVYIATTDKTKPSAGGNLPELMVKGTNLTTPDTWTVTISDLKGCSGDLTLTFKTNGGNNTKITANGTVISITQIDKNDKYSYKGTIKASEIKMPLVLGFSTTKSKSNIRFDDIVLTGVSSSKTATKIYFNGLTSNPIELTNDKFSDGSYFRGYTASVENDVPGTITYESSNTDVASVNENGNVSISGFGTTNITAKFSPTESDKYEGSSASYTIVNSRPSSGIAFLEKTKTVDLKDMFCYAKDIFSNPNNVSVTFESSNEDVAALCDNEGDWELKSEGTTILTAKFDGDDEYKEEEVSMQLTVVDSRQDAEIGFEKSEYEADASTGSYALAVKNPHKLNLSYTVTPNDALYDGKDVIFPDKDATYTITASYEGDDTYKPASVTCTLVVKAVPSVDNVTFIPGAQKGTTTKIGKDEMSSGCVTISSTSAAFAYSKDYRFYNNATHTFSTTRGTITKIEFIGSGNTSTKNGNSLKNIKLKDITVGKITTSSDNKTVWEGDAAKVTFTTSSQARATQIIVTLALPKATDVTYSEDATNSIVACENANVTLTRTLHSGMWNTFCVPFDVDADKVKAAFGNGVQVATFNTEETTDGQVSFTLGSEIKANEPCLLMPAEEHDNVYKFENVKIVKDNDEYPYVFTLSKNSIIFAGFYSPTTLSDAASKFNEDKTTYFAAFLGANNKLYKADPASGSTNAFRAFFAIPDGTDAQSLKVAINGVTTSISAIDAEQADDVNAPVYNLQGQRVDGQNLSRGIYVKNGKKFVVSK